MPSKALNKHLPVMLKEAGHLLDARKLASMHPAPAVALDTLDLAAVVFCVSAWQSYVEKLVNESVEVLKPPSPPMEKWPSLKAYVGGLLGRFNTPDSANVKRLFDSAFGLPDVTRSWAWKGTTPRLARDDLDQMMDERHKIVHGESPRPVIHNNYAWTLTAFVERLAKCTDDAVRNHLVTLGVSNPW